MAPRAKSFVAALLLLAVPVVAAAQAPIYKSEVLDQNLVGMTVTNYGFWGNNFVSRAASLEYPLGAGFEHLVRGGLWVGARALDSNGAFTGVTTGALDGSTNDGGSAAATEFTPITSGILYRSRLGTGPRGEFYSPTAVSEWDAISQYGDPPGPRAKNNSEDHRSMGLKVTQYNYAWSFANYAHILFFHIVVTNTGPPLADVWLGAYNEFASGAKYAYPGWPPSASNGGSEGSWFSNKKLILYDEPNRTLWEHYCLSAPVPGNCNLPHVPYWVGLRLLGTTPANASDATTKSVTFVPWAYAPTDTTRGRDVQRYALLSGGVQPIPADLGPGVGDPVTLQGMGPFPLVLTGESVALDFAIIGAPDSAQAMATSLFAAQRRGAVAQRAYDLNYIVPVPPPPPNLKIVARDTELDVYWDDGPESAVDETSPAPGHLDFEGYRVYLGEDRNDLHRIAQFDKKGGVNDTTGFNTGFDLIDSPTTIDGHLYRYRYTVKNLRDGFKYYAAVTAYDLGSSEIESLESGITNNLTLAVPAPAAGERAGEKVVVFPNPYRVEARWDANRNVRDHYLWFANLPERCVIRIYTLSGDLVVERDFDGDTYHGAGARGIYDPVRDKGVAPPTLSGRMFGWDLITDQNQAAASGLYLYSVEDKASGKRTVGKVLIVKSDKED
jgi:hypothetical protein